MYQFEKHPCVYMMASDGGTVLYIGVTSNIAQRVCQHKSLAVDGFSQRYRTANLVWFEFHDTMESAIAREKQLKSWNRNWKIRLVEKKNKNWKDLYYNSI